MRQSLFSRFGVKKIHHHIKYKLYGECYSIVSNKTKQNYEHNNMHTEQELLR